MLYALFICLLFNEYDRNLFLLWLRLDLTRLIIVFIFYYSLRLQSLDKYEKKRTNTVAKMNENENSTISKKCIDQNHYTLETRWSQIVSFRKTYHTVKQYSFEKAYCTDMTRSHIVSFRKSVLCNHYISILQSRNSIKKNWKYLIFSHINRFDSLTDFSQIKKARFCILCIDVCSQCMSRIRCTVFFIDFSIIWHILWTFYSQIA